MMCSGCVGYIRRGITECLCVVWCNCHCIFIHTKSMLPLNSPPLPQELEVMARAHGMPTPALMPETKPLAHAAEQALGSVTPRSSTPSATTPVSLLTPQRSARETPVDLTELVRNSPSIDLRASPGLDLAKLNLDDSRGLTHSPHTPRLEQIMEDESTQQSSHPMDS